MAARWTAEQVLALAPDEAARRTAAGLARPAPWSETGAAGDLVWGLCAGSGKNPYQAIVDLTGPAYRCSCPSRKFPCKHALALLLLWAAGVVPDEPAPADYALAWQDSRREKSRSRSVSGTKGSASPESPDPDAGENPAGAGAAGAGSAKDAAGAARRARERAQRVAGGLAELREWLADQVRVGLAASVSGSPVSGSSVSGRPVSGRPVSGAGGVAGPGMPEGGHAAAIAARMVDAQAPGVAGMLRGLSAVPASGEDWPGRLLGDYARLHLLARAYERVDTLPSGLAAVVRSRVGYTTSRQEVLTLPAITDHWVVIGVRDLVEGTVPGRRIWLRGRDSGRTAMLLTFAGNGYWQDPETARLRPGTELHAGLHYYPGQPPLRALTGERHAAPAPAPCPEPAGDIDALLAGWAAGLAADPWLTTWPALLTGTPVPPVPPVPPGTPGPSGAAGPPGAAGAAGAAGEPRPANGPWYLLDETGAAVPLADQESLWTLLAVSGGSPVTVAGEWHGRRLLPLTVWHHDQAVPL
jgi:SWIM zinc finger